MGRIFNRKGGWHVKLTSFRSGLEDTLAEQIKKTVGTVSYEKFKIGYTVPATEHCYTPDFVLPNGIIIESKGIFDATDRKKHLLIKKQYPKLDIRFVFSNPSLKIYKGSKTTCGGWCEKYGFLYASKTIPPAWFKEAPKNTEGLCPKGKEEDK